MLLPVINVDAPFMDCSFSHQLTAPLHMQLKYVDKRWYVSPNVALAKLQEPVRDLPHISRNKKKQEAHTISCRGNFSPPRQSLKGTNLLSVTFPMPTVTAQSFVHHTHNDCAQHGGVAAAPAQAISAPVAVPALEPRHAPPQAPAGNYSNILCVQV